MTIDAPDPLATSPPLSPGRRARKKAATRQAISDVATRLFMERGFDAVTVAEVAEAADVSVKTVFNHFGSKEELFLDRDAELRGTITAAVTLRPAGQSITGALLALLGQNFIAHGAGWEVLGDPAVRAQLRRFLATWKASAALQGRQLLSNERLHDDLCRIIAGELGTSPHDDRVQAMGAMLVAAAHLRHRAFVAAMLADAPAGEVERRVREVTAEAIGRVAAAFPELDVRR